MIIKLLRRAAVALAVAIVALAGTSLPAHADTQTEMTDYYTFSASIGEFLEARDALKYDSVLDWSSDGCSQSPDNPLGFKFLPSCQRHDFGYRNYKSQGRFNEDLRKRIDVHFKRDLYDVCDKYSGLESWKGVSCRRVADTYYGVVRAVGNS